MRGGRTGVGLPLAGARNFHIKNHLVSGGARILAAARENFGRRLAGAKS